MQRFSSLVSRVGSRVTSTPSRSLSVRYFASKIVPINDTVKYEQNDKGVGIITLNRPQQLNAMNDTMGIAFKQLIDDLRQPQNNRDLRALILTGAGKAFSAGGDLEFLLARCKDTPHNNAQIMYQFYQRYLQLIYLPVPIIAAINGPAIGAGFCVSLACDIRVANPQADVGLTFSRLGLHPGMGCTHFLPNLIGHEKAALFLMTGDTMKATRAHELGAISTLSTETDALSHALKMAHDIAAQPGVCMRTLTTSLRMRHQDGLERALWREADAQSQTYREHEFEEKVLAIQKQQSERHRKKKF